VNGCMIALNAINSSDLETGIGKLCSRVPVLDMNCNLSPSRSGPLVSFTSRTNYPSGLFEENLVLISCNFPYITGHQPFLSFGWFFAGEKVKVL
jgi:sorbitol-specific phosphotransferase system component IIBC